MAFRKRETSLGSESLTVSKLNFADKISGIGCGYFWSIINVCRNNFVKEFIYYNSPWQTMIKEIIFISIEIKLCDFIIV